MKAYRYDQFLRGLRQVEWYFKNTRYYSFGVPFFRRIAFFIVIGDHKSAQEMED